MIPSGLFFKAVVKMNSLCTRVPLELVHKRKGVSETKAPSLNCTKNKIKQKKGRLRSKEKTKILDKFFRNTDLKVIILKRVWIMVMSFIVY